MNLPTVVIIQGEIQTMAQIDQFAWDNLLQRVEGAEQELVDRLADCNTFTDQFEDMTQERKVINPFHKPQFAQLTPFRGRVTENWTEFLSRFNRIAKAGNWDDNDRKLAILPTLLLEHAEKVYENLLDTEKDTLPHLTDALNAKFNNPETQRLHATQFTKCVQESTESAEKFADRLQGLVYQAYPDMQDDSRQRLLFNHFLNNIREELRFPVLCANPTDFTSALAAAKRLETEVLRSTVNPNKKLSENFSTVIATLLNDKAKANQLIRTPHNTSHTNTANASGSSPNFNNDAHEVMQRDIRQLKNMMRNMQSDNRPRYDNPNRTFNNGNDRTFNSRFANPTQFRDTNQSVQCWTCGKYGHTSTVCRSNTNRNNFRNNPNQRNPFGSNRNQPAINGPTRQLALPAPQNSQNQNNQVTYNKAYKFRQSDNSNSTMVGALLSENDLTQPQYYFRSETPGTDEPERQIRTSELYEEEIASLRRQLEEAQSNSERPVIIGAILFEKMECPHKNKDFRPIQAACARNMHCHDCGQLLLTPRARMIERNFIFCITCKAEKCLLCEHDYGQCPRCHYHDKRQSHKGLLPPPYTSRSQESFRGHPRRRDWSSPERSYRRHSPIQHSQRFQREGLTLNLNEKADFPHQSSEQNKTEQTNTIDHNLENDQSKTEIYNQEQDNQPPKIAIVETQLADLVNIVEEQRQQLDQIEERQNAPQEPIIDHQLPDQFPTQWHSQIVEIINQNKNCTAFQSLYRTLKKDIKTEITKVTQKLENSLGNVVLTASFLNTQGSEDKTPTVDEERPQTDDGSHISQKKTDKSKKSTNLSIGNPIPFHTIDVVCLISCLLIFLPLSQAFNVTNPNPMICQTHRGQSFWTIPDAPVCKFNSNILGTKQPIPGTLKLFKYNDIEYQSTAWHCKRIKKTVKVLTYFFADERIKRESIEELPISQQECERMKRTKTSAGGPLVNKNGLWQNDKVLPWHYMGGGIHCCFWATFSDDFYYLYKTKVFKRHDSSQMTSPVGSVSHCHYDRTYCQLNDLSTLIWEVNTNAKCQYLAWKNLKGQIYGTHWVSEAGDLALTWESNKVDQLKVKCQGMPLTMSDQGIVFRILTRNKRDTLAKQTHSWVATEQLAAQLQALQENVIKGMRTAFKQSMATTCQTMAQIYNIIRTLLYANPIHAARILLNNSYIYARASANIFEIFPCTEISPSQIQFRPMNKTACTRQIPVLYTINKHKVQGYLDAETNMLIQNPEPLDCSLDNEIPIFLNNTVYFYSRKTGAVRTPSKPIKQLSFYHPDMTSELEYKPIIYHELIMYNLSEIRGTVTLNDIFSALQYQNQIYESFGVSIGTDSTETAVHKFAKSLTEKTLYGFIFGQINWYQIWLFLVAFYVTFLFVFLHCLPESLVGKNFNMWLILSKLKVQANKLASFIRNRKQSAPPEAENNMVYRITRKRRKPLPPNFKYVIPAKRGKFEDTQLQTVDIESPDKTGETEDKQQRTTRPSDRLRPKSPVNIYYSIPSKGDYLIIQVEIGQAKLLCLYDTGSPVTLLSETCLPKIKEYLEIPVKGPKTISISGQKS